MWYEEQGASISIKALERTGGEAGCYVRVPVAAGRYCLIDMHVPPCGGPAPHRHDFEEMFTILEGEIEVTFRGEKSGVRASETVNIPANAPHFFRNVSERPARMLCMCSPAGQEEFFMKLGVPVARSKHG